MNSLVAADREFDETQYVDVPRGRFVRGGSSAPDEGPRASVFLDAYSIGVAPVTNVEYRRFVRETGHRVPPLLDDERFGADRHPVVGVSWHDAFAYCAWLTVRAGRPSSLPTEAQWERAARGDHGATYSWGEAPPQPSMVNASGFLGGTTAVGEFANRSPHGLVDCLGNVWEWCADWYDRDYYGSGPRFNPPGPGHGIARVARGGSWRSESFRLTCAHRCFMHPSVRSDRHGFRVVASEYPD